MEQFIEKYTKMHENAVIKAKTEFLQFKRVLKVYIWYDRLNSSTLPTHRPFLMKLQ